MPSLAIDARRFVDAKSSEGNAARARAAYFLSCGAELYEAMALTGQERLLAVRRLERMIERERLKGARRHWSYDLNRHIALKQALDLLRNGTHSARAKVRPQERPTEAMPKNKAAPEGAAS